MFFLVSYPFYLRCLWNTPDKLEAKPQFDENEVHSTSWTMLFFGQEMLASLAVPLNAVNGGGHLATYMIFLQIGMLNV